ncbi:MAG: MgtC/SapB family protein [Candidatus Gygaella obscura]|nr:MgtC/SapB family protein [Candidatus Gygaella obscura]
MDDKQIIIRLVLALVFSGVIGIEREVKHKNAGFRTHILVGLGSCLMMLTSLHIFDIYIGRVGVDPMRLASGVITGIGFLGAGAIIRYGEAVRGLTTAATIWIVAGIGIALGCGFYKGALYTTGLTLFALFILSRFERSVTKER